MVSYIMLTATDITIDGLVLILVVMEDGLVLEQTERSAGEQYSLNPCCNGRWSRTHRSNEHC